MGETVVVATAVRDECMDVNDTKNRETKIHAPGRMRTFPRLKPTADGAATFSPQRRVNVIDTGLSNRHRLGSKVNKKTNKQTRTDVQFNSKYKSTRAGASNTANNRQDDLRQSLERVLYRELVISSS